MDPKQSFNLNADFLGGFSSLFIKLVFVIIAVYMVVLILNFLRDKFINKSTETGKDDITTLLTILNKLFYISGFGFVIGNIVQVLFSQITRNSHGFHSMNFRGEWDYLTFGIILIFIGIGFKIGIQSLKEDKIAKS